MDPKELDALVDKIPAIRAYYAGTTLTTVEEDINCLCDAVAQLARREARLREALERTTDRLSLAFGNKPVRDVEETLADARRALAEDAE